MKIHIHYFRIDRAPEHYVEELLDDEGWRVRTLTHFAPQISRAFSKHWIEAGLMPVGSIAVAVAKYLFPGEPFAIMEPLDAENKSFGLYVDICLPVERGAAEFFAIHDLMLDLWFPLTGSYQEMDWDEFEQAREQGSIPPEQVNIAIQAVQRLRREISEGRFPGAYIR